MDRRTKRVEVPGRTTSTGDPVWAEIVEDLTWGELKRMQRMDKPKYDDVAAVIAPYVMDWNLEGRNADTGDLEPVPAPQQATDPVLVFDVVEPWVIDWLWLELRTVHIGGVALQKKPASSEPTPATESGSN